MNFAAITVNQWIALILSTLAGIIVGSILIPKPVKGGALSVLIGGIIGAIVAAYIAAQLLFYNLSVLSLRVLTSFFIGALIGVVLVKLIFQETKRFRTEA